MRTSEVAKSAGVNLQTLRYYERRGLLPEPARRASGYREYEPNAVQQVRFIKRAQDLGFTLDEILELLDLRDARGRARSEVRALATAKIGTIDEKLQRLGAMRAALLGLVEACECEANAVRCAIIEALEDGVIPQLVGRPAGR